MASSAPNPPHQSPAEPASRPLPSGSRCGRSSGRSPSSSRPPGPRTSPDGGVDDLHHALVDALTHVDQGGAALAHAAQQQTCNSTPARLGPASCKACWVEGCGLTHGGGEDHDAQHVHLLAAAGAGLVGDLRGRSQLQVDRATFGLALVRDQVDEAGLDGPGGDFEDGDQVGFVLRSRQVVRGGGADRCWAGFWGCPPAGRWPRSGWTGPCFCGRKQQ